jgi:hypothetical protein
MRQLAMRYRIADRDDLLPNISWIDGTDTLENRRSFLVGDRCLNSSLRHKWLLNSLIFIHFYRRYEAFK